MISGQTGYSLGFGLELSLTIDVGNCPLSSVNRGTWLTKTSLYDLPANHSSRNELGSSNALVSTNGYGSPGWAQVRPATSPRHCSGVRMERPSWPRIGLIQCTRRGPSSAKWSVLWTFRSRSEGNKRYESPKTNTGNWSRTRVTEFIGQTGKEISWT